QAHRTGLVGGPVASGNGADRLSRRGPAGAAGHAWRRPRHGRGHRGYLRAPACPRRDQQCRRRRRGAGVLRTDHARPGHPGKRPGSLPVKIPRYLVTGGIVLLAVALALAVGYWNIRPASFTPQVIQDPLQPDFFMDNARIRQLDVNGQPVYDLDSVRAAHQVGDDVTELDDP